MIDEAFSSCITIQDLIIKKDTLLFLSCCVVMSSR